jgi:hypothetical protein
LWDSVERHENAWKSGVEMILTNYLEYEWLKCLFHFRDIGVCDYVDMKISCRNKLLEQHWADPLHLPSPTCP